MKRRLRLLPLSWLPFAGCLSSAPPLPPVRWFDPSPPAAAADLPRASADLRVTAAGHLGREFVIRTGPREIVFDDRHGWIDEPQHLVAAALRQRIDAGAEPLAVLVETFELDLQTGPRAVVRCVVQGSGRRQLVTIAEPASAADAPAFADAMARALARLSNEVALLVRGA